MAWIPIAAWLAAAVVAVVVLGYCAYEIRWKTRRLQRDVGELTKTADQLQLLRGRLVEVQQRLASRKSV